MQGSIPAHAGKPRRHRWRFHRSRGGVYPRPCGETATAAVPDSWGLSPPMRGNLTTGGWCEAGVYPRPCGETIAVVQFTAVNRWVYPRPCGETRWCRPPPKHLKQVYPRPCGETSGGRTRFRGRRGVYPRPCGETVAHARISVGAADGSIPAHAGKPLSLHRFQPIVPSQGLSPPMRGNRRQPGLSPPMRGNPGNIRRGRGSIPAHAGKPSTTEYLIPAHAGSNGTTGLSPPMRGNLRNLARRHRQSAGQVYPRPCGETLASAGHRGWPITGSIPAHAGKPTEPGRGLRPSPRCGETDLPLRSRVYPRPCGETCQRCLTISPVVAARSIPAHAGKPLGTNPLIIFYLLKNVWKNSQ